jgi:uncharacterized membrane protein YbhN (UPF0104 family)
VLLPVVVLGAVLWLGAEELARINVPDFVESLGALSAGQWRSGLAATLLAYLAPAGQERAVVAHLGLRPELRRAQRVALATAAVAQTVGFGHVVGPVVCQRLLPGLSMTQSFAISAGITLAFFAGLAFLASCVSGAQV